MHIPGLPFVSSPPWCGSCWHGVPPGCFGPLCPPASGILLSAPPFPFISFSCCSLSMNIPVLLLLLSLQICTSVPQGRSHSTVTAELLLLCCLPWVVSVSWAPWSPGLHMEHPLRLLPPQGLCTAASSSLAALSTLLGKCHLREDTPVMVLEVSVSPSLPQWC